MYYYHYKRGKRLCNDSMYTLFDASMTHEAKRVGMWAKRVDGPTFSNYCIGTDEQPWVARHAVRVSVVCISTSNMYSYPYMYLVASSPEKYKVRTVFLPVCYDGNKAKRY